MTKLPPHLLQSFQELYKQEFGEELTDEIADDLAFWFVEFLGTVASIRAERIARDRQR